MRVSTIIAIIGLMGPAAALDTELKEKVPEGLTWQQWHMQQEHGIDDGKVDPETFFNLHDFGKRGSLDSKDILTIYGLLRDEVVGDGDGLGKHDQSESISLLSKQDLVDKILFLMDLDKDGEVSLQEFLDYSDNGANEFPDLGFGVGHHLTFEEEYEQHHWNKYHRDQDPDIKIVHKEDVEHELLHHEHELDHGELETFITGDNNENKINQILLENVPQKYLA